MRVFMIRRIEGNERQLLAIVHGGAGVRRAEINAKFHAIAPRRKNAPECPMDSGVPARSMLNSKKIPDVLR